MAYTWGDNVHTTAFTPRDYQVELLAAAFEKNTIVCIEQNSSKEFIALKLIHELGSCLRQDNPKATVYLSHERNGVSTFNFIYHLTDLVPLNYCTDPEEEIACNGENLLGKVIIINPEKFLHLLQMEVLHIDQINLIVVENCHKLNFAQEIQKIFSHFYQNALKRPKILGLAGPFHNARCPMGRLSAEIEYLERFVHCKTETASDIVTLLRYCTKPHEMVVQCAPLLCDEFTLFLAQLVQSKIDYLADHRFDPTEIYSDEYYDELKNIPDPKAEPITFLSDFLQVLKEFGPWCADRAALALLIQIEKSKVKTPYERHFLLLCMTSTTFVQVRAYCDSFFSQLSSEKDRISQYSSPKVLRLLSILSCFKPDPKQVGKVEQKAHTAGGEKNANPSENGNFSSSQLTGEIDSLDFKGLALASDQIEEHVNGLIEMQESVKLKDTLRNITEKTLDMQPVAANSPMKSEGRTTRVRRRNLMSQNRQNRAINNQLMDPDALCGLIFCDTEFTAKVLFSLLYEISKSDSELNYLSVQYIVDKVADPMKEVKQAENEHRKQEEVLKRFRMHECNLLIGTAILEKEIDLPKCNLVIRWNPPKTYRSYVQCKGRARAPNAHHIIMIGSDANLKEKDKQLEDSSDAAAETEESPTDNAASEGENLMEMTANTAGIVKQFAEYAEMEKMLLSNCANNEPGQSELLLSDRYTQCIVPYKPLAAFDAPSVNLSTAVALVNKYCAKLPSDTFTKLTPIWRYEKAYRRGIPLYKCSLRLPINSPLKCDINGYLMPSRALARRLTALIACRLLHICGELDDNLQPIGKEGYRAFEPDWENFELESSDEMLINDNLEPRPGTTKRRQYYYKRVASALSGCRPIVNEHCFFYYIQMILKCPIPEEQNTRGRKIYPPEESLQGFGILTLKKIPQISAFPIFTRSGEVEVSLRLISSDVVLNETNVAHINTFINYTFTNVLRLQKYLMLFDPDANENCYFVVPTVVQDNGHIAVDWEFLRLINANADVLPQAVPEEERATQVFDANKFKDAVVMPWYRNQDQPQYFYVAEICFHLSPESSFPGENYSTFREYYFRKYGILVQNCKQPLLDVDHTSARLNFLTPRYVNRKGVALPTSSEETKRAKRENLEQKQILVPELCTIHPFSASLWRAAVCLPCILYRFNALLLADEIRCQVSQDLGLGRVTNEEDFEWPSLDFGWSLAEVLRKSREVAKSETTPCKDEKREESDERIEEPQQQEKKKKQKLNKKLNGINEDDDENTEDEDDEEGNEYENDLLEIGTWSNDMANNVQISFDGLTDDHWAISNPNQIRYGSPTSWNVPNQTGNNMFDPTYYETDSEDSLQSDHDDAESVKSEGKMRIEFKSDNLAEAIETEEEMLKRQKKLAIINDMILDGQATGSGENDFNNLQTLSEIDLKCSIEECERQFELSVRENIEKIEKSGMLLKHNEEVFIVRKKDATKEINTNISVGLLKEFLPYAKEQDCENFNDKGGITLDDLQAINDAYIRENGADKMENLSSGYLFDRFIVNPGDTSEEDFIRNRLQKRQQKSSLTIEELTKNYEEMENDDEKPEMFSFDYQPSLKGHPGPSPSIILQALTMSNANDGINLERLETIGDSFLKYAITTYLYCTYEDVHEGKLSHLRSKQVSNLNLYRLGRRKMLGESMISTKFEPHDNWLPPCYYIPKELEKALIEARIPACHWNLADLPNLKELSSQEICNLIRDRAVALGLLEKEDKEDVDLDTSLNFDNFPCFIPYNLVTQHSIPDKSVADCVEALIGAYLIECGPRGALLFMAWVGIRVLPCFEIPFPKNLERLPGTSHAHLNAAATTTVYGWWSPPKSPLLHHYPEPEKMLMKLLDGFDKFEETIGYEFRDKSYLLQAMTHASYSPNRLTDCYQRLEFLGDAVLDYLITRHLYEDPRQHSPGALTDLRSALVNNTIFASLAVRHGFHKYFRHLSPGLNEVIDRFVRFQHENGHSISEEYYLISEDECDEAEDVEVPKALGDVFESVAGAIFLDSGMSLDAVWKVYSNMMRPEIEQFSNSVPKSPIRELLELEPETAKFSKPEKLADGRRVRVMVEVFGKGTFRGIGRNYRIAKCTAAKCALRQLKKQGLIGKKH
ncbi:endoribonuclease Dcr-1 [Lutzomyia longipalpis]|uniref:endoribonuclease Dcr-1 n=1 Tax=Lutzomyia longipalpis TaxID=7200 RepID=UPI0024846B45|nr:endoribonuclease Dcr-1 [Lutzomyia longipalpis]